MVMVKPMQLTMVKAVPLTAAGAFCATRVENKGESAMTTIPQNKRNNIKIGVGACSNSKEEIKQQQPDKNKETAAIRFTPLRCEI